MRTVLCVFFGLICMTLFAQNDTLVFKNKDVIVGELKELKSNIIIMKTSYSDSDFKIEFDKVASLNLENKYSIILSSGERLYGTLKTKTPEKVLVINNGYQLEINLETIVILRKIEQGFWNNFKGTLDFGYNLA